jgi:hypothetical protein
MAYDLLHVCVVCGNKLPQWRPWRAEIFYAITPRNSVVHPCYRGLFTPPSSRTKKKSSKKSETSRVWRWRKYSLSKYERNSTGLQGVITKNIAFRLLISNNTLIRWQKGIVTKISCTVLGITFLTWAQIVNIMHVQCNHGFKLSSRVYSVLERIDGRVPISSSEWMLHKDYYRKGSVAKSSGREP